MTLQEQVMRKTLIASALAAISAIPALAIAADAPPVTGNFTIASDYRFRGISQTYKLPAVQGGIDYAHSSGAYVGTWMSNVSSNSYPNGASLEWDMYAGFKTEVAKDTTVDVGVLYYYYPGAKYNTATRDDKYNNTELYIAGSYKWLTAKYSYTLSDFFGTKTSTYGGVCENPTYGNGGNCISADPGGSKGSGYLDLTAAYPITDKLTLNAHIGHQKIKNYSQLDYTDWKLGVSYDLNGWSLSAAYIDTNANKGFYYTCETGNAASCKKLGEGTIVLSVGKTF